MLRHTEMWIYQACIWTLIVCKSKDQAKTSPLLLIILVATCVDDMNNTCLGRSTTYTLAPNVGLSNVFCTYEDYTYISEAETPR